MTTDPTGDPTGDPTEQQRKVWDAVAGAYDRQMRLLEPVAFAGGREWLGARARGRVLEVAIGTGRNLPHYPPDVTVSGIDLSAAMLTHARHRAEVLGRAVDLRVADAEALPFPDATFDTVVCALSLCNIPRPGAAVAEMVRVLVPGGRLLLLDHVGSDRRWLLAFQRWFERFTIRAAGEYFTRRQLPLVEAAGLEVVESERRMLGTVERVHAVKPG